MKNKLFLLITLLSFSYASTAAAFLDNGASARSEAMGRAFTGVADNLDAFYYNPAGYAAQKGAKINSLVTRINNTYDVLYLGLGTDINQGDYVALNVYRVSLGDIPLTTYESGEVLDSGSSFEYGASAYYLSYAFPLARLPLLQSWDQNKISLGLNIKYLTETLQDYSASGTGLDLGIFYKYDEQWQFGISAINLVEPIMSWSTGQNDIVARKYRLGIAFRVDESILLTYDNLLMPREIKNYFGMEFLLNKELVFRAGILPDNYALGLGLEYDNFNFDYGFLQPLDSLLEASHRLSLGYTFDFLSPEKSTVALQPKTAPEVKKEKQLSFIEPEAITKDIKTSEPAVAEVPQLVIDKRSFIAGTDKIKCFYKVKNNSSEPVFIKVSIIALTDKGNVAGERKTEVMLAPQEESLINELIPLAKKAASYQIKTYLKPENSELLSFVDNLRAD